MSLFMFMFTSVSGFVPGFVISSTLLLSFVWTTVGNDLTHHYISHMAHTTHYEFVAMYSNFTIFTITNVR